MHFITNGFKRFSKGQLDRSKATCSFKKNLYSLIRNELDEFGQQIFYDVWRPTHKAERPLQDEEKHCLYSVFMKYGNKYQFE